jgi:NAD dependent epimerase/dehydratase family
VQPNRVAASVRRFRLRQARVVADKRLGDEYRSLQGVVVEGEHEERVRVVDARGMVRIGDGGYEVVVVAHIQRSQPLPQAISRTSRPSRQLATLYGRRTNRVRVLWVVASSLALHTGYLASDGKATTFVTGSGGFVGTELVNVPVASRHQVFGLTRSVEAARRVSRAGAIAVKGDLLEPGQWQDEAAADWVFHILPHPIAGPRVTRRRAASITRARALMDGHLLTRGVSGVTGRIVYVADTSCYGATGPHPITEDEPSRPSAWGRCNIRLCGIGFLYRYPTLERGLQQVVGALRE